MNSALRMARARVMRVMDAKLAMKINSVKDSAKIDRRETSFSGSYLERSSEQCHGESTGVSRRCAEEE